MSNIKTLPLSNELIPYKYIQDLIANQKIGGVFLVFLEGKTKRELQIKSKKIEQFCKKLNKEYENIR